MLITVSSVNHLRSKRGLPLANQILGWVVLGERSLHFHLVLQTRFLRDDSLRFVVPIRVPDHAPKPVLEDSLVLPRFLGLLRDAFYQCRGALFSFILGLVGYMG